MSNRSKGEEPLHIFVKDRERGREIQSVAVT